MRIRALAPLALAAAAAAALATAGCGHKRAGSSTDFVRFKQAAPADAALVFVFRHHSEPVDAPATILANGAEVLDLKQFEYTWFHAPPGQLALGARWPQLTRQQTPTIHLDVEAGGTYYVELTGVDRVIGQGTARASAFEPLPLEQAERRLQACAYRPPRTTTPGK